MSNKMKTFEMKDIHSGYVVKFRNGKYALCMRVGTRFTKIFACVDGESQKIGAEEGKTFVYASSYRDGNYYRDWNRVTNRPSHNSELDIVAIYGLIEYIRNYLNICDTGSISIKNRPLLWEEDVKEMTLEEIEAKLGHRVKIITPKSTNNTSYSYKRNVPIRSDEVCRSCKYSESNSGCAGVACSECKMGQGHGSSCRCLSIRVGEPCPYFEEEPDNE